MKRCTFTLEGMAPIAFGRPFQSTKNDGETHDAYEQRVWRERMHTDREGKVVIPAMAIKNALSEIAKFLGRQIPGKGKNTYTKHFEAGVLCVEPLNLGVLARDVPPLRLYVPSDGKRGGSKRVWKHFPVIDQWKCSGELFLVDDTLIQDPSVIREHLEEAGKFIGLGSLRVRNNGILGRFKVTAFKVFDK